MHASCETRYEFYCNPPYGETVRMIEEELNPVFGDSVSPKSLKNV